MVAAGRAGHRDRGRRRSRRTDRHDPTSSWRTTPPATASPRGSPTARPSGERGERGRLPCLLRGPALGLPCDQRRRHVGVGHAVLDAAPHRVPETVQFTTEGHGEDGAPFLRQVLVPVAGRYSALIAEFGVGVVEPWLRHLRNTTWQIPPDSATCRPMPAGDLGCGSAEVRGGAPFEYDPDKAGARGPSPASVRRRPVPPLPARIRGPGSRAQAQVQADMPWTSARRSATAICSARVARSARGAYFSPPAAFQLDWVNCRPP